MKKAQVFKLVLCLVIALSVMSSMAACNGGSGSISDSPQSKAGESKTESQSGGSSGIKVTPPGEFPIVETPMTLTAFALVPPTTSYTSDIANNEAIKFYEEKTNIKLEWEFSIGSTEENQQKLQLKLISGNYPDIFLHTPMDRNLLMNSAKEGIFIALNDLIDTQTVHLKKLFEDKPAIKNGYKATDGNIYGLGYVTEYYHGTAPYKLWIYQPWLDQLKLPMPKTTEEFYTTLKAFKDNNLGIPLLAWNYQTMVTPFIYYDGTNTMVNNDKVDFVGDKEEFREALRYMKRLYVEELVPKDIFTMDDNQKSSIKNNPEPKFGAMENFAPYIDYSNLQLDSNGFSFNIVPVLEGPNGTKQVVQRVFSSVPERFAITSACKNPEVAIRWVDWLYSFEGLGYMHYGPQLESQGNLDHYGWYLPKDGDVDINGNKPLWGNVQLSPDHANYNPNFGCGLQVIPWFMPLEMHTGMVAMKDSPQTKGESQIYRATEQMEPYKANLSVPAFFMSEEGSAKISSLKTPLNELVKQAAAEFITGVRDLDKDWDAYVNELKALSLDEYVQTLNAEYKSFLKNAN